MLQHSGGHLLAVPQWMAQRLFQQLSLDNHSSGRGAPVVRRDSSLPKKKDPHASPAQKLLGLYGLLLFTGRAYSLPRLAVLFRCSKQTVLRMIEQIQLAHRIRIETWSEGNRSRFQVKTPSQKPNVTLDVEAIQHLMLCRDIVWHLACRTRLDSWDGKRHEVFGSLQMSFESPAPSTL